jgi:hypothetical protein
MEQSIYRRDFQLGDGGKPKAFRSVRRRSREPNHLPVRDGQRLYQSKRSVVDSCAAAGGTDLIARVGSLARLLPQAVLYQDASASNFHFDDDYSVIISVILYR